MRTHLEDGKWWVSPYNFEATVRDGLNLPEKVEIHDATLRDGEQTPGVVFQLTIKSKLPLSSMNWVWIELKRACRPFR